MNRRSFIFSLCAIMSEAPRFFDEPARKRIAAAVKRVEGTRRRPSESDGPEVIHTRGLWLAQNSAYQAANSTATTWTIYHGDTKGSETSSSQTGFQVYLRRGLCFASVFYELEEIDGYLEVRNPTLSGVGKSNTAINKGAGPSNGVDIYSGSTIGSESSISQTLTAWNRFANVASGKWVRFAWNDDSKAWDLVAAEC